MFHSGLERARKQGRVGGRPRVVADREKIREMRAAGQSFGEIAKQMNLTKTTIARIVRAAAA